MNKTKANWQRARATIAILLLFISIFQVPAAFAGDSNSNDGFELHGTVSQLPGTANFIGNWIVSGRTVRVTSSTILDQSAGSFTVGAYVEVKGIPQSDGSINATKVDVELPAAGSNPGGTTTTNEIKGNIEELPATAGRVGDWKVAGRIVRVSATTFINQEKGLVAVGVPVEVNGTSQSDGSLLAVRIETKSLTSTESKFTGTVEALPAAANRQGDWKVSGRVVRVNASTDLKQSDGAFALGVTVKVEGVPQADGAVLAQKIETKGASREAKEINLRGTIEALPATSNFVGDWKVSGRTIKVSADTKIVRPYTTIVLGAIVEVEGYQQADNSIQARKVEIESHPAASVRSNSGYVRFYGTINTLPATQGWIGQWVIANRTLNVTTSTVIDRERGAVATGALVEVHAVQNNGVLDAVRIEVKNSTSSSAGYYHFYGTISQLPGTANFVGDWTVGNTTVHVTSSTRLNQERGAIAVNVFVEVEGNRRADGSIDAAVIEVKTDRSVSADSPGFVHFYDNIVSLPAGTNYVGTWKVGARTVNVSATTRINQERGAPSIGLLVEVKGVQKADGSIDATVIETKGTLAGGGTPNTLIEFVGVIKALPSAQNLVGNWTVDDKTVRVSSSTFIKREHGAVAVGLPVEVKGALQSDGSIDATVIEVKRASNITTLNRLTSVNAGGYQSENSVEGIIAAFGSGLANVTQSATTLPLPTSLGGVSVLVDGKPAPLFFVSPTQINYQVPTGTAIGTAKVEVLEAGNVVAQGVVQLPGVAASVFSFNGDGQGVPAGYVTRVKANGEQETEAIHRYNAANQRFEAAPLVRKSGEDLYLIMYGTGFKSAPDSDGNKANGVAENVEVYIGGVKAQVDYVGSSPFVGVEQMNVKLPDQVLTGANVGVLVKVFDGQGNLLRTNEVKINVQ